MKKPEFKKIHTRTKESGTRDSKPFKGRGDVATSKPSYSSPKNEGSYAPRTSDAQRFEKPIYKGKEDRLAGTRTRSETRAYSGYAAHSPKSSSSRAYSSPKSSYVKRVSSVPELQPTTKNQKPASDTSWGSVADWYNKHLENGDDTYHAKVLFPNILRMLGDITGKRVLDLACGQGIFSEQLRNSGAFVTGVDLGKELIAIAEANNKTVKEKGTHKVVYHVASADDLLMLKNQSFDVVVCILALQNIENLQKTIGEAKRVLAKGGVFLFVLNHPSYRNPKQTRWGYNEADDVQYRRVDEYMSESHVKIDMTPGSLKDKKFTVSFHRPLQVYMKALTKSGFAITRLEEWISHKESEKGPKQRAENKARKEIPMFMCIEGQSIEHRA